MEFKKGPFYLYEDVQVPISPYLLSGAFELWPPGQLCCLPGRVRTAEIIVSKLPFQSFL